MKKFITYILTIALSVLLVLYGFSKVSQIGANLEATHPSLEYIYYALFSLVVIVLIIIPLVQIMIMPYYSINSLEKTNLKRRAKKFLNSDLLKEERKEELRKALEENNLEEIIKSIYDKEVKKAINKLIVTSSKETMFLTAVSQSSFIDTCIVLINNIRMVKKIIILCGFRPHFFRLAKLYLNILISSFIADGMQKVDIASLINTSLGGVSKVLTNSAFNGVVNAFFMLRVGVLTREYLYTDDLKNNRLSLKNNAFLEASKLLPSLVSELVIGTVKDVVTTPINVIKKMVNKKEKEEDKEEVLS